VPAIGTSFQVNLDRPHGSAPACWGWARIDPSISAADLQPASRAATW
jgi:hypothetical protein